MSGDIREKLGVFVNGGDVGGERGDFLNRMRG